MIAMDVKNRARERFEIGVERFHLFFLRVLVDDVAAQNQIVRLLCLDFIDRVQTHGHRLGSSDVKVAGKNDFVFVMELRRLIGQIMRTDDLAVDDAKRQISRTTKQKGRFPYCTDTIYL